MYLKITEVDKAMFVNPKAAITFLTGYLEAFDILLLYDCSHG